ncbi:MAG: hypothetical protein ACREJ0_14010 [Geminicoccaceae bacterium]
MTAAPKAGKARAACRPDWRLAAQLLANGEPLAVVARILKCSRSQLSHKRNHDPLFQDLIEEFRQLSPAERLARLRHAVHRAIDRAVADDNVRVVLWLADRLKLVTPPGERTVSDELRELLNGLSADELREFESLGDSD